MKRVTLIAIIFIHSLMNGFANTDPDHDLDHMKHVAQNLRSVMLESLLNDAIEECPDLVQAVINEQQKNLTLEQIVTINKNIIKQINEWEETFEEIVTNNTEQTNEWKEAQENAEKKDEIQAKLFEQNLRDVCSKYNISLPFPEIFDSENDKCLGSPRDKLIIDCILRSYCPDLIAEAGKSISEFLKKEL